MNRIAIANHSRVTDEVNTAFIRLGSVKAAADMVSNTLNWIRPECGGRMGGRGKEFKCQGECQTDSQLRGNVSFRLGADWMCVWAIQASAP